VGQIGEMNQFINGIKFSHILTVQCCLSSEECRINQIMMRYKIFLFIKNFSHSDSEIYIYMYAQVHQLVKLYAIADNIGIISIVFPALLVVHYAMVLALLNAKNA